ncbi:sigma-70 family RNA polymerase sigma factor [Kribbella sp. NBC_01505]|uniref:RNA polymerase sigma factor n=1 Tax=Kribbella sp. NBC_01505 TaxID=2903580 RepID=UPI003866B022
MNVGERFQSGDESVLTELYRRYSGPMFATALSLLGDRELAADAVQRAFLQAWQGASRFDPSRELQPWLYAITRRAAIDVYRRARRTAGQVSLDANTWVGETVLVTEGPSFDTAWQVWQVRQALEELPADERHVLQLAYFEGCTQTEIAARLDLPLGTVKSRTHRAQRRLAALLSHLREPACMP